MSAAMFLVKLFIDVCCSMCFHVLGDVFDVAVSRCEVSDVFPGRWRCVW